MTPPLGIEHAREEWQRAIAAMEEAARALEQAGAETSADDLTALEQAFDSAEQEAQRCQEQVERLDRVAQARARLAGPVRVGREAHTYRQDTPTSYFRDLLFRGDDPAAAERLARHAEEIRVELRDVTTGDPGATAFVPPVYLDEMWAELPREGRPFADALPTLPLPDVGNTIDIPKVQSGTTAPCRPRRPPPSRRRTSTPRRSRWAWSRSPARTTSRGRRSSARSRGWTSSSSPTCAPTTTRSSTSS